jgi:hypothetical protein
MSDGATAIIALLTFDMVVIVVVISMWGMRILKEIKEKDAARE